MVSAEPLGASFEAATWSDWVDAVGGEEAVARLVSTTEDGIRLRPVYPADGDRAGVGFPGGSTRTRGRKAAGTGLGGWDVRALHADPDVTASNRAILDDLERGVTSLLLRIAPHPSGTGLVLDGPDALDRLLEGVHLDLAPVALDAGAAAPATFALLESVWDRRGVAAAETRGAVGLDPFALRRADPATAPTVEAAVELAASVDERRPAVSVLTSDGPAWSAAGATDAQELAVLVATAVEMLRAADRLGRDPAVVARRFEARLTVGSDQFATIAKIRAARRLWQSLTGACGLGEAEQGLRIHAVAAEREWTRRDPWVNVLRATVAAFGAGVAGADSVTVLPHDHAIGLPGRAARRLARNVQTILMEESGLARVIDPAGGSPYVEARTEELAAVAWARFQQIERAGGLGADLDGALGDEIATAGAERARRVATRRRPITGVSEFPQLDEAAPSGVTPVEGASEHRLAARYEALRDAADAHARRTGARPTVTLATLGSLARHATRAGWTANLLAAGGLATVETPAGEVASVPLVVLCGDDATYDAEAVDAVARLKEASVGEVWLAGRGGDAEAALREAGVERFVHVGVDVLEALERAHDLLEVTP